MFSLYPKLSAHGCCLNDRKCFTECAWSQSALEGMMQGLWIFISYIEIHIFCLSGRQNGFCRGTARKSSIRSNRGWLSSLGMQGDQDRLPNNDALHKPACLAYRNRRKEWIMPIAHCGLALSVVHFGQPVTLFKWYIWVFVYKLGVESTIPANSASNCFIIENILPKGVILSDFIYTLALSNEDLFDLCLQHKVE